MTARAAGARWLRMIAAWTCRAGASPASGTAVIRSGLSRMLRRCVSVMPWPAATNGLRFDWFVAVAGVPDRGAQAGLVEDVVGQASG